MGWYRVRARCWRRGRTRSSQLATWSRPALYLSGLLVLAAALMSPIDALGGQLFFMHMVQHLLTMMVAAPLLWLATPFPFVIWGLPAAPRRLVAGQFARDSWLRRILQATTRPLFAWLAFLTIYLGWHEPILYNLALQHAWIHDLQHVTFFAAAMLFWWHVIDGNPRLHGRFPVWARLAYLILLIPPNMLTGVFIAFSSEVIYAYYESIPRVWGFTVLQDQMLGGVIMWIPGSMMLLVAGLAVVATQLQARPPAEPRGRDGLVAPGEEHDVLHGKWRDLETPVVTDSK